MSEIIHAVHPIPIRYVPRRGRKERLGFVRAVSPVRLPTATAAEMRLCASIERDRYGAPVHLYESGGRLWTYLAHDRSGAPVEADYFKRALACSDMDLLGFHGKPFHRTPLRALETQGSKVFWTAGVEADALNVGRSVHADPDGARAALARYLEDNVRIVSDKVFVRTEPLAYVVEGRGQLYSSFSGHPSGVDHLLLLARLDRIYELAEFERRLSPEARIGDVRTPEHMGWYPRLDVSLLSDADLLHFGNEAPRKLLLAATDPFYRMEEDLGEERMEALRAWTARGSVGTIGPDDLEEVVTLFREGARLFGDHPPPFLDRALRYADEIVAPRLLDRPALVADDADAFADLAPGAFR